MYKPVCRSSFYPSFPPSLPPSLPTSLPPFFLPYFPLFFSLSPSLTPFLPPSLLSSFPPSLSPSPPFLPPSSFPPSLPPSLPLYRCPDPRVKDWMWMQSPLPTLVAAACYLTFVRVAPGYMKHRKPFEMKPFLFVFNTAIVLLNAYLSFEVRRGEREGGRGGKEGGREGGREGREGRVGGGGKGSPRDITLISKLQIATALGKRRRVLHRLFCIAEMH